MVQYLKRSVGEPVNAWEIDDHMDCTLLSIIIHEWSTQIYLTTVRLVVCAYWS